SRSRKKLWNKGEESGHFQDVKEIFIDCDCDTVLITVEQTGAACHTGRPTCFYRSGDMVEKESPAFEKSSLKKVFSVIDERKHNPIEGSYVSGLMKGGLDRILKKIPEEAGEVVIAAKNRDKKELVYELADLWFHSMVLLCEAGFEPRDIYDELERRFGKRKEEYSGAGQTR
ncbi:MAG: phosphoribosyl-ATP diphosphatase, partial [Candidatus Dadabacteria bacterium]|nr:phosphoribosyl-ATP diphosphatase [Candidatus Dadabacteria bacterium]